jgi:hypothetical protein
MANPRDDDDDRLPVVYEHRARPYSPEARFEMKGDHVAITQGNRSGNFIYRDIVLIRLLYRPRNTTNEGYQTKLYRRDRKTAALTNLSWKSLVDLDRQDDAYARFVRELISAVARDNPAVTLAAGMPRWQHLVTAGAALVAMLALLIVLVQALRNGGWAVAGLTAALGAYFGWWSLRYLSRNRPRTFTRDVIPADVMPPRKP